MFNTFDTDTKVAEYCKNDIRVTEAAYKELERENKAYDVQELLTNDYHWDDVSIYIGNYIVTVSVRKLNYIYDKIIGLREWDLFHPSSIARTINEEGNDHIIKSQMTAQKYRDRLNQKFGIINNKPNIKKVIFNEPATIVFWDDGTKTVVKAEDEAFDKEKGLAMAISKKFLGNKGNYYNEFKKWVD